MSVEDYKDLHSKLCEVKCTVTKLDFAGLALEIGHLLTSLPDVLETIPAVRILRILIQEESAFKSGARPVSTALSKIGLVEKLLEVVKDPASLEEGPFHF